MSSFEWAYGNCAWCHPGGGNLEYDRAGYRYDNRPSGLIPGGTANPQKDNHKGDYYIFVAGTGIVSRVSAWINQGVGEADCLMCHLNYQNAGRFANLERNYTVAEPPAIADDPKTLKGLKFSPTLGLARTGLLTGITTGSPNINPSLSGWSWASTTIPGSWITMTPPKENCSICHFPDRSWFGPSGSANRGPADRPLGFTSFQKRIPAGTVTDDDEIAGVGGKDGKNDAAWDIVNGRVEGGKRGESINDPNNPDAHMDRGFVCATCHYTLGDEDGELYGPKRDAAGNIVAPQVNIKKIDHQFAKGDAFQDTKGMDQVDYTVTCESCHITKTHPNAGNAPTPTHAGFPSVHFVKIHCKTCHIPVVNGPVKQFLADFSAGPYRGFARVQSVEMPSTGIGLKPLKTWQKREDGIKLVPHGTMAASVWVDGSPAKPTFQRYARAVAVNYRAFVGDANGDGLYDWPLNRPHDGGTRVSHIVNDPPEIAGFVARLNNPTGFGISGVPSISDPVLNIYNIVFSISHNIQPITRDAQGKPVPGPLKTYTFTKPDGTTGTFQRNTGPLGINGCVECHSSSDPNSKNYSPKSIGFFDMDYTLYLNSSRLTQTCTDSAGNIDPNCTTGKRRVRYVLSYKNPDGSSNIIDLGSRAAHGQTVPNTVNQAEVMGYSSYDVTMLTDPATAGIPKPRAQFAYSLNGLNISVKTSTASCSSTSCSYNWSFGDGSTASGLTASYTYSQPGTYTVKLTVVDNINSTQDVRSIPVSISTYAANRPPQASWNISVNQNSWTVSITDTSTDPDGNLSSITINWGDGYVQTLSPGATVTRTYATQGSYSITLTAKDSTGAKSSVSQIVSFSRFKITGSVTNSSGNPVGGATLKLYKGSTLLKTSYSTTAGSFSFTYLKPGTYTIKTTKSGYTFPDTEVTVGPDQSVTIRAQ
ncbi:MAG: PKD domain-containing protein [Thermodesulfovibrionales bacterium]|nr:PKD domain-containing protein [Thermodesulfovibrionales bacterium]